MPAAGRLALALLDGTVSGFVLALIVVGFSLSFGVLRIVNVAHGEFFMLGAVLASAIAAATGSLLPAAVAAPAAVMAIAALIDRLVLRPIRYAQGATLVATLGVLYILQQLTLALFGPEARSVPPPIRGTVELVWFGYSVYKLVVAFAAALFLLLVWGVERRTGLGLGMRAAQQDPEIAQAFGIPVHRIYTVTFVLAGGLAALAGVLVVPFQQAHYLMGLDALLSSFVVVILGGLGHLGGTVAASLLVGWIDGIVSVFLTPTLSRVVASLVVALVLVVRGEGLMGNARP